MPFQGFVDEFTNSPIQPAFSAYLQLLITDQNPPVQAGSQTSPIQLDWANLDQSTTNPFSQLVKVTFNDNATNTIKLPDATLSSVQQTILFANTTETAYQIVDFADNAVTTIESGQVWFIALTDNTGNNGTETWFPEVFGGVNTPANAAALVGPGYGLLASNSLIVENNLVVYLNPASTPYTIQSTDRGHYLIWDGGGSYTINLPETGDLPNLFSNGFIFALATAKDAGAITINAPAGQTIDGLPTLIITADKSTFIVADGQFGWNSLGYELTINSNITPVDIPLNNADIAITVDQAASVIQNLVNAQPGPSINATVNYPTQLSQQYFISNLVTNPITTIATLGPTTTATYTLASGETSAFFMEEDGELVPTLTKFFAANGSATNPIFQNIGNPATGSGIYFTSGDNFPAISQGGNKVIDFSYDEGQQQVTLSSPSSELAFTLNNNSIYFNTGTLGSSILSAGTKLILGPSSSPQIVLGSVGGLPTIGGGPTGNSNLQINAGVTLTPNSGLRLNGGTLLALTGPTTTVTATTSTTVTTPIFNLTSATSVRITTPLLTLTGSETITGNLQVDGTITGGGLPILPLSISNGGTNAADARNAFKNLAPTVATGDMIYRSNTGFNVPLNIGAQGKSIISNGSIPAWNGNSILQIQAMPTYSGSGNSWPPTNPVATYSFTPTFSNSRLLINISLADSEGTTQSAGVAFQINGGDVTQIGNGRLYGGYGGGGSYTGIFPVTSTAAISFTFIVNNPYGGGSPTAWSVSGLNMTLVEIGGF